MSGSTGGGDGAEQDILKLGIDASGVKRGGNEAEAALDKVKEAAQDAAGALDKVAPASTTAGAGLSKVPGPAQQAGAGLTGVTTAATGASTALGKVPGAAAGAAAGADKTRDAAKKAAEAFKDWERALAALDAGAAKVKPRVDELAQQFQRSGLVSSQAAQKMAELHVAMETNRKQALALGQGLSEVNGWLAGRLHGSVNQVGSAVRGTADRMRDLGSSARLTARELQMLAPQLNDIFTQLSMGQGVMMTLMAQGPQIVQGFGGVTPMFSRIVQVLGAGRLAVAGFAAAGVAAIAAHNAHEGALASLRNRLRTVSDEYTETANAVEAASRRIARTTFGVSRENAQDANIALRGAGRGLGPIDVGALTADIADFSRTVATDFAGATQLMTRLMRDPAQVVQELADKGFPGLNQSLIVTLEALQRGGSRAEAFQIALDRIRQQTRGAREDVSPLSRAWEELSKAMGEFWDAIGPAVVGAGAVLLNWLASLARGMTGVIRAINQLRRMPSTNAGPVSLDEVGSAYEGLRNPSFGRALAQTESGGTPGAVNAQGYLGLYQFGAARLADLGVYRPAPGENLRGNAFGGSFAIPGFAGVQTREDFLANAQAQEEVFRRHVERLDAVIDALGVLGTDLTIGGVRVNREGLRAVGHLGGEEGLARFVASRGEHNPGDANGTRLMDYFRAFSVQADRVEVDGDRVTVPGGGPAPGASSSQVIEVGRPGGDMDRALRIARGSENVVAPDLGRVTNLESVQRAIELLERMREVSSDPRLTDVLDSGLQRLRATAETLRDPIERYIEEIRRSAAVAEQAGEPHQRLTERMQAFDEAMRQQGVVVSTADRMRVMVEVIKELNAGFAGVTREVERQIASTQTMTAAYQRGDEAVARATERERAIAEVRRAGVQGAEAQAVAVDALAEKYRQLTVVEVDRQSAAGAREAERQIELLEAEARLAGATADERERELAALRERQRIQRGGGDVNSGASQAAMDTARRLASTRLETQRITNSWRELEQVGVQAFERVGSAITEALATGELKALRFADIWRAVMSEAAQAVLKLGVINPLLNSVFGGTRGSLWDLFSGASSAASAGGGGVAGPAAAAAGGGGGGGLFLGAVGSQQAAAAAGGGGGLFGGLGSLFSMGSGLNNLTGGGLFNSGLFSGVGGWLGSTIPGTGVAAIGNSTALYGEGVAAFTQGGVAGANGTAATAGATWGQALGGIGIGYMGGSLIGGMIAGDSPARQTNAQIGAGGGAVAGAVIGSVFPVIGTMAGAIIGGLIGGAGGGLLGPGKGFSGGDVHVGTDSRGLLRIDGTAEKNYDMRPVVDALAQQIEQINALMQQMGVRISGDNNWFAAVGAGESEHPKDLRGALMKWMRERQFQADDPLVNQAISGTDDIDDALKRAQWVKEVYQPMVNAADGAASFRRSLDEINKQFADASAKAQQYGLDVSVVTEAHQKAINDALYARQRAAEDTRAGFRQRELSAGGTAIQQAGFQRQQMNRAHERERADFQSRMEAQGFEPEWIETQRAAMEAAIAAEIAAMERQYAAAVEQTRRTVQDTLMGFQARVAQASGNQAALLRQQQRAQEVSAERQRTDLEEFIRAMGVGAERAATLRAELERAIQAEGQSMQRAWEDLLRAQTDAIAGMNVRLLRARGGASGSAADARTADLAAFDAQASAELAQTIRTLQTLGVSADQVAAQVARLTEAHTLEREAIERAYVARRQAIALGLEDRLFAATTDTNTEAGALAALERQQIRERQAAVKEGLTDLTQLEAVHAAERAKVLEQFAKQTEQAVRGLGGSIRSYLDALENGSAGGLGSPQSNLAAAQEQFARDLTLARGGDQEALGRITGTADALLGAGRAMYGSSPQFQALLEMVKSSLGNLPAVKSYDQLIYEELVKLGGAISVEVLVDLARKLELAIEGDATLTEDQKAIIATHTGEAIRTLKLIVTGAAGLTPAQKQIAEAFTGSAVRTLALIVEGATGLTPEQREIAAATTARNARTLHLLVEGQTRGLTDAQRELAMMATASAQRALELVVSGATNGLTAAQREIAFAASTEASRLLRLLVTGQVNGLSQPQREMALMSTGRASRTLELVVSGQTNGLSAAQRELVLVATKENIHTLRLLVSGAAGLTDAQREILLVAADTVTRALELAVNGEGLTRQQRELLAIEGANISRVLDFLVTGAPGLTEAQKEMVSVVAKTAARAITFSVTGAPGLTPAHREMLAVEGAALSRTLSILVNGSAGLSAAQREILAITSGAVAHTLEIIVGGDGAFTEGEREILRQKGGKLTHALTLAISGATGLTDRQKEILGVVPSEVERILHFLVQGVDGLTDAQEEMLAVATASVSHTLTLAVTGAAALSPDQREIVTTTGGNITRTLRLLVDGAKKLTAEQREIAAVATATATRTLSLLVSGATAGLTESQKQIALARTDRVTRTLRLLVDGQDKGLTAAQKQIALAVTDDATRTLELVVSGQTAGLTSNQRDIALAVTGEATRSLELLVTGQTQGLTEAQKQIALSSTQTFQRTMRLAVSRADMSQAEKDLLLNVAKPYSRALALAVGLTGGDPSLRQAIMSDAGEIARTLKLAAEGGQLTEDQRRIIAEKGDKVSKQLKLLASAPGLTDAERAALLAVDGEIKNLKINQDVETNETVQISRSIDDKLSSILNAINTAIMSLIAVSQSGFASVAQSVAQGKYVSPGSALQQSNILPGGALDAESYVKMLYRTLLRRDIDPSGYATYVGGLQSGQLTRAQVLDFLLRSPELWNKGYPAQHFQEGGWVANGVWNRDSVVARLAGGGMVELAGGEHVTNAVQAARFAPELNAINAGTYQRAMAGNDNSALIREIRALTRAQAALAREVAALRAEAKRAADAGERTADAAEDTAASNKAMARDSGAVVATRRRRRAA